MTSTTYIGRKPAKYDVAQICENGHKITKGFYDNPQLSQAYCEKCGAATLTQCRYCHTEIRGRQRDSFVGVDAPFSIPSYCMNCGKPYPWTEAKMAAARELVELQDELTEVEKATLIESIDDVVRETPSASVSGQKAKRLLGKLGAGTVTVFREILVDVLSETAKRAMFGP